jgi:hypothetical protein
VIFRRWRRSQVVRTADTTLYRIGFHRPDRTDPRDALAVSDRLDTTELNALDARLADWTAPRTMAHGPRRRSPWSPNAPDTAAADLAARLGMDTPIFKRRVRQLKELGPTLSQPVGHRLSPRGTAYLTGRPGR